MRVRKRSGLWTVGHQGDSSRSSGFAQLEAHEPTHLDVLAELGHRVGDHVFDGPFRVANERLLEQADVGEELVDLAIDDLLDDLSGLPEFCAWTR